MSKVETLRDVSIRAGSAEEAINQVIWIIRNVSVDAEALERILVVLGVQTGQSIERPPRTGTIQNERGVEP